MYLITTLQLANAARVTEFESYLLSLAAAAGDFPGLLYGSVVNSLGQPAKFATVYVWETEASFQAFFRSPNRTGLVKTTEGIFTRLEPHQVYELQATVGLGLASTDPRFVTLAEWTLDEHGEEAFVSDQLGLLEVEEQHDPLFAGGEVWRYLGSPGRYIVTRSLRGQPAGDAVPAVRAFRQGHPQAMYSSVAPTVEQYRVVGIVRGS